MSHELLKIRVSQSIKKNNQYFEPSFLQQKREAFQSIIDDPEFGFYHIADNPQLREQTQKVYEKFKTKKHFVHVGIGGSSLGPQMLVNALKPKENNCKFTFINNIDPDVLDDQLYKIDIEDSLFYVVSKSGGTAETMASLAIILDLLQKKNIKPENYKNYLVFCTDPERGDLRQIANDLSIECLDVPPNVGGRFTVFTPVGFLPALFAGINIHVFCEGANSLKKMLTSDDLVENKLLESASALYALKKENDVAQTVIMPYSSKLKDLSAWFVQLWAESLGKAKNLDGEIVHQGFTPIPAYGATDQHSQVQLFMEGPYDKCLLMIDIEKFNEDFSLNSKLDYPSLKKLAPHSLSKLMRAEFEGTLQALDEYSRPFIQISLPECNARTLGALLIYLESLTAIMGYYLNINPFDQPGVEAGKKYAFEWLVK